MAPADYTVTSTHEPVFVAITSRLGDPTTSLPEVDLDHVLETSPVYDPVPIASQLEQARLLTFEEVIHRHQEEIYRYAVQLTRNRVDADDLYQETLLKAYRAFGRLDGAANHRAWLYRIATNTFLSDRRKLARVDQLDEVMARTIPAAAVDHAASLDARDLLREVAVFVEGLPPKQRAALTLRKYHELGYEEIAAALGSSEAAARASVHAALRKLRERFANQPIVREVIVGGRLPDRAADDLSSGA
jgi:RNA polymerase sigma factor (sigma-70 family)